MPYYLEGLPHAPARKKGSNHNFPFSVSFGLILLCKYSLLFRFFQLPNRSGIFDSELARRDSILPNLLPYRESYGLTPFWSRRQFQHLAGVAASRQSAAFFTRNREAGGAIENGLPNAGRWAVGIPWRMV